MRVICREGKWTEITINWGIEVEKTPFMKEI